jgi:hypothetical protein
LRTCRTILAFLAAVACLDFSTVEAQPADRDQLLALAVSASLAHVSRFMPEGPVALDSAAFVSPGASARVAQILQLPQTSRAAIQKCTDDPVWRQCAFDGFSALAAATDVQENDGIVRVRTTVFWNHVDPGSGRSWTPGRQFEVQLRWQGKAWVVDRIVTRFEIG